MFVSLLMSFCPPKHANFAKTCPVGFGGTRGSSVSGRIPQDVCRLAPLEAILVSFFCQEMMQVKRHESFKDVYNDCLNQKDSSCLMEVTYTKFRYRTPDKDILWNQEEVA